MRAPLRILLVEDDPAYARLVQERLRDVPELALVATAGSLASGVEAARQHTPDVVMLDLALPDSEGVATVAEFRQAVPSLPLVVLSGLDDIDVGLEAMRHGAQEYLVKGQAEAQLFPRAARSAIERKRLQELEQLLIGVVSHDLRNPLHTIILVCELVASQTDEATRNRMGRALAAARRAHGLVNDLLDATRARLGGLLPVELGPADLGAVVRNVVSEQTVASRRVILYEGPASLPMSCDEGRIAQVLTNLLGNAVQHSEPGTPIRVRVVQVGDGVRVSVHNTGAPIPDELRPRLFAPLERAQLATKERTHSIGLGLYIVHEIVHAHGGTIDVTSSAGDGTTFTVDLPLAPTPRDPA